MSKVAAYYHIVFCTKGREMTITKDHRDDLYRFIWHELQKADCRLLRIGGIQNHIHMLIDLHPGVALAALMRDIKSRTSVWIKRTGMFPYFKGWSKEYYASSISPEDKDPVIEYIKGQEQHHLGTTAESEIEGLYRHAGLPYDPRDMQ